uniref:Secreted protein n=1 Tax=Romanomermis culicivorax TaxID=13658 RepID=A0A915I2X6_ROMCU
MIKQLWTVLLFYCCYHIQHPVSTVAYVCFQINYLEHWRILKKSILGKFLDGNFWVRLEVTVGHFLEDCSYPLRSKVDFQPLII